MVCQQPIVSGPCEDHVTPWGYNHFTNQCEKFVYRGCQGNDNRFSSKEACQEKCVPRRLREFLTFTSEYF